MLSEGWNHPETVVGLRTSLGWHTCTPSTSTYMNTNEISKYMYTYKYMYMHSHLAIHLHVHMKMHIYIQIHILCSHGNIYKQICSTHTHTWVFPHVRWLKRLTCPHRRKREILAGTIEATTIYHIYIHIHTHLHMYRNICLYIMCNIYIYVYT